MTGKDEVYMLHLIQLMNHMMNTLEYSVPEIQDIFSKSAAGELPLELILDSVNMEVKGNQLERMYRALPRWESALSVVQLRTME